MINILSVSLSLLGQSTLLDAPPASAIISALPARCVGPSSLDGTRFDDIAVYDKEPRIFYIACANGGLLKTTDSGKTCRFVFDNAGSSNIGVVSVSQKNPDLVWIGTGDRWQRNSVGRG